MERGRGFEFWDEAARHDHDTWWNGPLHVILLLLLVALLVLGIVWLVRQLRSQGAAATGSGVVAPPAAPAAVGGAADPAVEALRMRYARGEVDREQFRLALEDLTGTPGPWPGEAGGDTAPTAS